MIFFFLRFFWNTVSKAYSETSSDDISSIGKAPFNVRKPYQKCDVFFPFCFNSYTDTYWCMTTSSLTAAFLMLRKNMINSSLQISFSWLVVFGWTHLKLFSLPQNSSKTIGAYFNLNWFYRGTESYTSLYSLTTGCLWFNDVACKNPV